MNIAIWEHILSHLSTHQFSTNLSALKSSADYLTAIEQFKG